MRSQHEQGLPCQRSWYRNIFSGFYFFLQEQTFRDTELYKSTSKPLLDNGFFGALGIFLKMGVRLFWKWMTSAEQRAKGCKWYREISNAFSFIIFSAPPHWIEWHIFISFYIGIKSLYPSFLPSLSSSDDECYTNSTSIINRFLISF